MNTSSLASEDHAPSAQSVRRKRFAMVGTGGRIVMFLDPLVSKFTETAELAALCDRSATRMAFHTKRIGTKYGTKPVPCYPAEQFDEMLAKEKPDCVIVCTVDCFHDEYLIRAVEAGCEVVVEKPVAINAEKCRGVMDAVSRHNGKVTVGFNFRWAPGALAIRRLIARGGIGRVLHTNMEYHIGTRHGGDYFRRWHSDKKQSGGLLVHKCCHHFDAVNWWIDEIPEEVFAYGGLKFYGEENARRRGEQHRTGFERYLGREKNGDPFHLAIAEDDRLRGLYLEAEQDSGYIRDRNVFRPGIDIEDSLSVLVRYPVSTLTYSLNAFCPREGMRVTITGEKGEIEYTQWTVAASPSIDDGLLTTRLVYLPLFGGSEEIPLEKGEGGHGGADPKLQAQIFSRNPPPDTDHSHAGHEQGVYSAMVGIAANHSLETGLPARISDLLRRPQPAGKFTDLQ